MVQDKKFRINISFSRLVSVVLGARLVSVLSLYQPLRSSGDSLPKLSEYPEYFE